MVAGELQPGDDTTEATDLNQFVQVFFRNKVHQSPFHDLPAAQLLQRAICIWVPELVVSHLQVILKENSVTTNINIVIA